MDWPIPLRSKPTVAQMGVGVHGIQHAVETFRLPTLWSLHLYTYHGAVACNGQLLEIRPGYASLFPPDAVLEYHYRGKALHLYAHFRLPRARQAVRMPAMQDLAADFVHLYAALEEAIAWFPAQQFRADIRLWDILWQLANTQTTALSRAAHPAVELTRRTVERRLAEPLYVTDLARQAHLSHNHLTRVFRAATGLTVTAYIRQRRIQHAQHLLSHSTLPIKSIAAQVGIPDLHLFNKMIRHALGVAPRKLRLATPASRLKHTLLPAATVAR